MTFTPETQTSNTPEFFYHKLEGLMLQAYESLFYLDDKDFINEHLIYFYRSVYEYCNPDKPCDKCLGIQEKEGL